MLCVLTPPGGIFFVIYTAVCIKKTMWDVISTIDKIFTRLHTLRYLLGSTIDKKKERIPSGIIVVYL
jgi:hypothetical protein